MVALRIEEGDFRRQSDIGQCVDVQQRPFRNQPAYATATFTIVCLTKKRYPIKQFQNIFKKVSSNRAP